MSGNPSIFVVRYQVPTTLSMQHRARVTGRGCQLLVEHAIALPDCAIRTQRSYIENRSNTASMRSWHIS